MKEKIINEILSVLESQSFHTFYTTQLEEYIQGTNDVTKEDILKELEYQFRRLYAN